MGTLEGKTERSTLRNPYIVGNPLAKAEDFFGRVDILRWVEESLLDENNNALVLYGQRRTGKTSLLLQLRARLPAAYFCPVYFDLMDQADVSLDDLLDQLSAKIAAAIGLARPAQAEALSRVAWFLECFLPEFLAAVGETRRPVLLLDEFDVLDYAESLNLPEDAAARSFFPYLRRVMTTMPRFAFLFVVGRQAEDLSAEFMSTLKVSHAKEIWTLGSEDTRDLILVAERQGTLHFTDQALDRIFFLTHGHPYLTQLLCYTLWSRLHLGGESGCPAADVEDVNAAVRPALELGAHGMEWIWDGLSTGEKIYSVALAHAVREGEGIEPWRVEQILAEYAPRLRSQPVIRAPGSLMKRRVLLQHNAKKYRFAIEMFRIWIEHNKSIDDVKHELDAIDPAADSLYQKARVLFNASRREAAIAALRGALELNPEHFGARLLLGEVHLGTGNVNEAIVVLERAYQMDPFAASRILVRTWRSQAERLGSIDVLQGEQISQAAAAYRRLSELEPAESHWREALAQVENEGTLLDRFLVGESALRAQRWTAAQRAFADVVYLRPTYSRDRFAADMLVEAVQAQPHRAAEAEVHLAHAGRELAYNLNAQQYGLGYENSIAQCTIYRDGSGLFRREIELRAYSVLTELNYYTKLPEKPLHSDVDFSTVRSLDQKHKLESQRLKETTSEVQLRNRFIPPLLPGEKLPYEGIESFSRLYAMPPVDRRRELPFDYYARDINCPTRALTIEIVFPPGIEPNEPWSEVWYAVGMSMVPHPSEAQRTRGSITKRILGNLYTLTLKIDFPVLGLTYVVVWRPDQLIVHTL